LPNGDLRIDEVEEVLGVRTERVVDLDRDGNLRRARSVTCTPVGSATCDVVAQGPIRVDIDDHGTRSSDEIPTAGPVLPGAGVGITPLALGSTATSGDALVITRTGARVVPVVVDRDERTTVVYHHWCVNASPSFVIEDGEINSVSDMVDTFPRSHEVAGP
jgi:hypothetical protein